MQSDDQNASTDEAVTIDVAPAAAANLGAFMRITGEAEGGEALLRESLARVPENAGTRLNLVAMLGNGGCIEMEKWPYATQDWKDWLQFKRANAKPAVRDRGRTAPAPRR